MAVRCCLVAAAVLDDLETGCPNVSCNAILNLPVGYSCLGADSEYGVLPRLGGRRRKSVDRENGRARFVQGVEHRIQEDFWVPLGPTAYDDGMVCHTVAFG